MGFDKFCFMMLIFCDSSSLELALIFILIFLTLGSQKQRNLESWFSILFLRWYLHYCVQPPKYLMFNCMQYV